MITLSDTFSLLFLVSSRWTVASAFSPENVAFPGTLCDLYKETGHPDAVPRLPNYHDDLPSVMFAGYLHYEFQNRTIHTHYTLNLAEDNAGCNDDTRPLIYWSNGGPGASSKFGLLTELGPLLLNDDGVRNNTISPVRNPYAWTKLGHVFTMDQPAPVGFSYCDNNVASHSCSGLGWTDELASANALTALQTFFAKFPCLRSQRMYLTGESYGGIYIPTLARRVWENNNTGMAKLDGIAVGDGCLGTHTNMCGDLGNGAPDLWHVLFLAGHGQVPLKSMLEVWRACRDNVGWQQHDDVCQAVLAMVQAQVGGFYGYNLYDECTYEHGSLQHSLHGAQNDYPCGADVVMAQYLALPAVQAALHVQSPFFEVDNAVGFDYTPTERDLLPWYQQVAGNMKILIYNGDTDPAITSFATQNWTSHVGLEILQAWRPWTVDGCRRIGGYVTRYDQSFDFLTIRGAGHMVPTYKSAATFTFLQHWINGTDYPTYNGNCTAPKTTTFRSRADLRAS